MYYLVIRECFLCFLVNTVNDNYSSIQNQKTFLEESSRTTSRRTLGRTPRIAAHQHHAALLSVNYARADSI